MAVFYAAPNTPYATLLVRCTVPCSERFAELEETSNSNDKDAYFAALLQRLQVPPLFVGNGWLTSVCSSVGSQRDHARNSPFLMKRTPENEVNLIRARLSTLLNLQLATLTTRTPQDYLAQAPSGVDTAALIHAFEDVPAGDVPVFRQLLQAIATCTNGEWTLRNVPRVSHTTT